MKTNEGDLNLRIEGVEIPVEGHLLCSLFNLNIFVLIFPATETNNSLPPLPPPESPFPLQVLVVVLYQAELLKY